LPGVTGHVLGGEATALVGTTGQLADTLRAYAALGISHVQLVPDPNTAASLERLAPMLEALDQR
jgi:alkanesulfonate monooxygenase SsuD/methylene tetrahydromethanopterin reductase-like flavin-dependent oxidoreductase (luciferase family)